MEVSTQCGAGLLNRGKGSVWLGSLLDGAVKFALHVHDDLRVYSYQLSARSRGGDLPDVSGMIEEVPVHTMEQAVILAGSLCRRHFLFALSKNDNQTVLEDVHERSIP